MGRLWQAIAGIGGDPADSPERRLRKRTLSLVVTFSTGGVLAAALLFALAGRPLLCWAHVLYAVSSLVALAIFGKARRGESTLLASQLVMNQIVPALTTLGLGGLFGSGGAIIWPMLSPMAALLIDGSEGATRWVWIFLANVALTTAATRVLPMGAPLDPAQAALTFALNVVAVGVTAATVLAYFVRRREQAHRDLERERERSERLLLNVLPRAVAAELKREVHSIAERHDTASVLFADLVGFTPLASEAAPEELVGMLDAVFSGFDRLVEERGLEKIKTVGDCYMVAAGVPAPRADHAAAIVDLALAMREQLRGRRFQGRELSLRIGVHSGPLVAGVIGTRKFAYDLWGDTVNTASRMESQGVPGEIQLSGATRALLGAEFDVEARSRQEIKGKGPMDVYLVRGRAS